MKPGMQRQAAYILPKPTAGNNNLANLQVIFPNQIADSAKVSETGIANVAVVDWIRIQPLLSAFGSRKAKMVMHIAHELASPAPWKSFM
jgi:hypothetical protein